MSDPPYWYSEEGRPRPGPPPYHPPPPPPVGPPGNPWVLPILFFVSIGVVAVIVAAAFLGLDSIAGWALTALTTSFGLGIAVVFAKPDRALPEGTRSTLQAIRVVAGVVVGLMVAAFAFVVYVVAQALNDPNTE